MIQAGQNKDFVLIGNKNDLEESRVITSRMATQWTTKYSQDDGNPIPYIETSAKDNFNVEQAFLFVAKNALKKSAMEEDIYVPGQLVDLQDDRTQVRKKGCC